jgi:hypothetical protein
MRSKTGGIEGAGDFRNLALSSTRAYAVNQEQNIRGRRGAWRLRARILP